jgi:hypothetical protein
MRTRLVALLTLCWFAAGGTSWGGQAAKADYSHSSSVALSASDRLFFPKNFLRGFTEAGYFPSHNEPDLGRCAAKSGAYGGANASCAAFSRYFFGGYAEFQPFARNLGSLPLNRVYLFIEPRAFFGRNVPQFNYTESFSPIIFERTVGVVIAVRKNFEVRMWQHQNDWLGRYTHNLGPADLGTTGPYGLHVGISTRWYFGGWGRQR